MPFIDYFLSEKKWEKKVLRLILEEGEDVFVSIKKAMKEHKLKQCKIDDMEGTLLKGEINFFEGNQFKNQKFENLSILRGVGSFKLDFGELYGSLSITTKEKNPKTGMLLKGKASEGLQLKISFIQPVKK
jgi:hypothetical protein